MVSRSPFAHQKDRDHKPRHSSQAAADATPSAARAHTSIVVWYKYETGTWPRKYTRLPLSSKRWLSESELSFLDFETLNLRAQRGPPPSELVLERVYSIHSISRML